MNYIGEFSKNSTILLELLTKDEENQPIPTDFQPTATIEHYDRNGLQEVDNVTLETMGDGRHTKVYTLPIEFLYGDYIITYKVSIEGVQYTTQEKFYLSRTEDLVQENNQLSYEMLDLMKTLSTVPPVEEEEPEEEQATTADGYIMPPEFAIALAKKPEVVNNQIIFTLQDNLKYNTTYRVVLDKEIRSLTGKRLGAIKTITFTSEYKPLFATPTEVQGVLRSTYKYFTTHDIYSAIRDAGEKAMTLLGNVADANNSRYREMRATDTQLFPTQKYVLYEASRILMTNLMVRILNGADAEEVEAGTGMINETKGSITLGDFSITDNSSSSSGLGGTDTATKEETPLKKLQTLLAANEKELKFWMDSMLGRNRRGYASPISSSFKTAGGSPVGRDFT
jgi:hypothetical protein